MPDVRELGRKVKAKYPGAYDDLDDADLGRKVKAKFPGAYDDFTDTPAEQPPGFLENAVIGPARGAIKYIADPILALAEGYVSPQANAQMGEQAARGAIQMVASYLNPQGGPTVQQPEIQAVRQEQEARRANLPGFKQTRAALDYLNARAALDPSLGGKITRGVGEAAVAALPATVAGAAGGGVPTIAGITALQSAAQPETAALNVGLGTLPVGQAFRAGVNSIRRAFGKGAAQIIEAEAKTAGRIVTGAVENMDAIRAAAARKVGSTPAAVSRVRQAIGETAPAVREVPPVAGEAAPAPTAQAAQPAAALETVFTKLETDNVDEISRMFQSAARRYRQKSTPAERQQSWDDYNRLKQLTPDEQQALGQILPLRNYAPVTGNAEGEVSRHISDIPASEMDAQLYANLRELDAFFMSGGDEAAMAASRGARVTAPQTQAVAPTGRVVTVGDKQYTLTPEQEARWIAEVEEPLANARARAESFRQNGDPRRADQIVKGRSMEIAKKKREIVGALTEKEKAAAAAREATNYTGKLVTVEINGQQFNGEVQRVAFGKVRVKLEDGSVITADPANVSARVTAPATSAAMEAPGLPDFNPPKLGTDLEAPTFGVREAPDLPYTETVGPRVGEPADALNVAVSNAAQSVPRSIGGRILDELAAIYHLPKTLKSSIDISAPFRQGSLLTIPPSQWGRAVRAGIRMFRAFKASNFDRIKQEIASHVDAGAADNAGLYLATKAGTGLQHAEEAFLSKYAGKIPLVKQSEQAYLTYLDSLRMDTFAKYKRVIDKSGLSPEQAQEAYKAAARWINYATGRGSLGEKIDRAMPALNAIFFSPRYVASRLNVLNPVYYAKNAQTAAGRAVLKQQMGELVQYAGMVAGTMALAKAAGADVGLNPNSPDFLKIRFGNWRYDTLAGLQQVMRLFYRAGADITRKARGQKSEGPNALEIGASFLRSKLAPAPAVFTDFVKGRTVTGKPFSGTQAIVDLTVPIQWADFVEAYQKEGWGGVAKASPGLVGFGVQRYEPDPVNDAVERARPLFTELQRLNKRVSDLRQIEGEPNDIFQRRVQQFSQNYTQFGQQLLNSPRFQSAPDDVKAKALDRLNERAKSITTKELAFPALELDPNLIMDSVETSIRNKEERKRIRGY